MMPNLPVVIGLPAGSDMRIFSKYSGIPALLFGPGGSGVHAADEFVLTDDIVEVTKVIASVIYSWCR